MKAAAGLGKGIIAAIRWNWSKSIPKVGPGGKPPKVPRSGHDPADRNLLVLRNAITKFGESLGGPRPTREILNRINPSGVVDKTIGKFGGKIGKAIAPMMGSIVDALKGPVLEQLGYYQDIREVASASLGIYGQEEKFQEGLAITEKDRLKTGLSRREVDKAQLKNLARGIRETKILTKVTTAGGIAARLIGSEAEATNEFFADMHQHLKMDNFQLSTFAVGMHDIARTTGLTGQNLLEVAKNSEQFMKNMRNSGMFTATAAKNITHLMAEAKKSGTTRTQRMLKPLTSGVQFMKGTDPQMTSFLAASAAASGNNSILGKLRGGTVMKDKGSIRQLTGGMEEMFKRITGHAMKDFDSLTDEQKALANLRMENATGIEANAMKITIENYKRMGMSFSDRVDELDKEIAKTTSAEEKKRLGIVKEQTKSAQTMEYLDEFNGALKNGTAGVNDFRSKNPDYEKNMRKLGIEPGKGANVALVKSFATGIKEQMVKLKIDKDKGNELDVDAMMKDLEGGDPKKMGEALDRLAELNKTVLAKQASSSNIMSQMDEKLKSIDSTLRDMINKNIVEVAAKINELLDAMTNSKWYKALQEGDFKKAWDEFKAALKPYIKNLAKDIWGWIKEAFSEMDIGDIAIVAAIAAVVLGLSGLGGAMGALIPLLTGPGGLIALLGVAMVASFVALGIAIHDLNKEIERGGGKIGQEIKEKTAAITDKSLEKGAKQAEEGNVSGLEARGSWWKKNVMLKQLWKKTCRRSQRQEEEISDLAPA